jgi:hypothetical protein
VLEAASAAGTSSGGDPLSETVLLESLDGKAQVLADRRFAGRDLVAALSTYDDASSLLDRIRRGYRTEASKLLLAERAAALHERAIAAALEMFRETGEPRLQELAFRFAEKSRSRVLLEALSQAETERFAGIPDTLLDEERALRNDLAFYERVLGEEQLRGEEADAAKLRLWQDWVFGLRRAYDGLLERLERGYPDYLGREARESVVKSDTLAGLSLRALRHSRAAEREGPQALGPDPGPGRHFRAGRRSPPGGGLRPEAQRRSRGPERLRDRARADRPR